MSAVPEQSGEMPGPSPSFVQRSCATLPVQGLIEELRTRHGKTPYADEFIQAVNEADENGDGLISIPELVHVIEAMHDVKKENSNLKTIVMISMGVLLLVLCAIFGLVFAVVKLTQEVSTGGASGNALISKTTGVIVDTHPSNGGGIFLDMAAFTEPVDVYFPGSGKTQTCVGQVPVDQIVEHYDQFTTGGSDMTLRHVDFSQDSQPLVYTVIPGNSLSVTGFTFGPDGAVAAMEATESIKNMSVGPNDSGRRLEVQARDRMLKTRITESLDCVNPVNGVCSLSDAVSQARDGDNEIKGKGDTVERTDKGTGTGRRMQEVVVGEEGAVATVDDYMTAFAAQTITIAFTKDTKVSEEFYFVCQAANTVAAN